MSQKEKIIELLRQYHVLTQGQLSEKIYGDSYSMPKVYSSLMSLVKQGIVIRTGSHPSYYSLSQEEIVIDTPAPSNVRKEIAASLAISNETIEKVNQQVEQSDSYGREDILISSTLAKFPYNIDLEVVAMKIGLIDITNSTNIARHKKLISVVELAEIIVSISDIDERIKNGDPEVVNIIAKANGKINLFSFASKYCCYHNKNFYGRDDYSIFDSVLKNSLPQYFDDITKADIQRWQKLFDYKSYNDYITKKLDELNITIKFRKRKFDRFVWSRNRK